MEITVPHFPQRLTETEFYPLAYRYMVFSRRLEESIAELFRKGVVKGTATLSTGNEATAVAMGIPFRPGHDVVSLLHRDFVAHLLMGLSPYEMLCQYIANADSPTHGREGNVHHGNAAGRRFPMMSHLGNMLATVVGGVYAARRNGEDVLGLAVIGDGGTSTGDFHESLNLASVRRSPVLFLIENNEYAFSTPTSLQYRCARLSDRAAGYGIEGKTVDGTDAWEVYTAVCDALERMAQTSLPYLLETLTLRLDGHAAYDKAEYVSARQREKWMEREPMARARTALQNVCGWDEKAIETVEQEIEEEAREITARAVKAARPHPSTPPWNVYAEAASHTVEPFAATGVRNQNAVTLALDYLLSHHPEAFLVGQDIGPYGSAFKTCKGLHEKYGSERVIDMPICESAMTGFTLGASQTGGRPIVEYQFADFATESTTQLALNCGTWFFRAGQGVPALFRLPCGGGITLGAFHSGEYEGLWSRFPGLKVLYPATPQEMFEALVAGFHDPNPCIVLEHKLLYTKAKGDIDFDGNLARVWRPRRHAEGTEVTVVALGAMVESAVRAASRAGVSADIWNPFALAPLDMGPLVDSVNATGRLLVVQESTRTGGLGDRFVSELSRACFGALRCAPRVIGAPDTPVPFAPELEMYYRPNEKTISRALTEIRGESP